jgi:pimeloyl-ACP methyl ester carboxylesterase
MTPVLNRVRTSVLEIACEQSGPENGVPVLLMHGFPYDPRTYDLVIPLLVAEGCRTIVPYLRGYGPTRFLAADTPRSGQQAALGNDLREFIDALGAQRAVLAGYDWGGRAACIVAALWPDKVRGLVSANGYNIQDIAGAPAVVSVLFSHRARARRIAGQSAGILQAVVAVVVTELAVRRCDL